MKKKKKKKSIVKTKKLLSMLKKVHLGGIFDECILKIKKGKGEIIAVDITNSMIVMANGSIMSGGVSGVFGLGNLELLVKFLSSIEEEKVPFKSSRNYFTIRRTDNKRRLDYLLTQTELIATRFDEEDEEETPYNKLNKMMKQSINLNGSFAKDFLTYIGLLKTKQVTMMYDGSENVSFICGSSEGHKFEIQPDSKVEQEDGKEFQIKINGEHLSRILSAIDFDEEELPVLSFAKNKPIMIEEGSIAWVLVPIIDIEEGIVGD